MPFSLYTGSAETSAARQSTIWLSRGLAIAMILAGLAALLGWGLGAPKWAAPLPGWRPMLPVSALLSISIGFAFWQRIH
ncbi:MAG TPA: hypothetical protein VMK53_11365, partial [Gemmatimonadales bacterium]|nr:hypothetical protein [Gemmatimonadales bacterium]